MAIRQTRRDKGVIITLDQPARANALCFAMAKELVGTVDEAVATGARAILLTGAGRSFCSGGQLDDPLPHDAGAILEETINPLMRKFAALEIPLIVALNGPAIGAGAALALAGDIVVAGRSAWLGFSFAQVGLVCDAGSSWLLPRTLGWHRAMAAMMLGKRISAEQALDWGLVTELVDDDRLEEEAITLLDRFSTGPTRSFGMIRKLARQALELSFEDALAAEREAQYAAGRTHDFREGAAAFKERRAPRFEGR
ncbi:enoyl-CoA hydratase-related protein [Sphingobium sp. EM0848]|uniref:enoyl-CoA hydratase-related protein n=1 Tax=Sphingobium sp. EM0848 TaxID=2743473 RepID=UPI00159C046F|nr:enoyl-CoA hydratase-related protein [Sphingobium sp. EM0848]